MLEIFVVSAVLVALTVVLFPFFLRWLAEENILFTTIKEGTVKAVMRGETFDHFIMEFDGYHMNDPRKKWYRPVFRETDKDSDEKLPDWEIIYHGKGNKKGFLEENADRGNEQLDSYYDDRPWLLKKLGLYWVGWPWAMSVYVYQFEWNETFTDKASGEEKILPRAEPTDFIYVADFIYAIKTVGAETKDRLPTDELTLITIAVRNPYRALFSGEDWMRRITATINRHVRTFVGSRDYQDLISPAGESEDNEKIQEHWSEFSSPIIGLNHKLPDDKQDSKPSGLKGRYGVEIRTADLQTMDLSGDGKQKHQEAATKAYAAEQDAKATLLAGKAKAEVIERIGVAEASALDTRLEVIKKHGDTGELLAQLDAMKDASGAGARTIWANSPFITKGA